MDKRIKNIRIIWRAFGPDVCDEAGGSRHRQGEGASGGPIFIHPEVGLQQC